MSVVLLYCFFFFNDTATTEIYTLSLHDALPIWMSSVTRSTSIRNNPRPSCAPSTRPRRGRSRGPAARTRSEEHTSELQSQSNLVCRLLLEKKKEHTSQLRDIIVRTSVAAFSTTH